MLRFIQEVNTTTRSCALWDLEEDTEYIVHVQAISIQGQSPASEPVLFKTPREAEKMASKNKGRPGPRGWSGPRAVGSSRKARPPPPFLPRPLLPSKLAPEGGGERPSGIRTPKVGSRPVAATQAAISMFPNLFVSSVCVCGGG